MKTHLIAGMLFFCGGALAATAPVAHAQQIEMVKSSALASVPLPNGVYHLPNEKVPAEISDTLQAMVQEGYKRGQTEVLGWVGPTYSVSKAGQYKTQLRETLEQAGWTYKESGVMEGFKSATIVLAKSNKPAQPSLIGMWMPTDSALILAWTQLVPTQQEQTDQGDEPQDGAPATEAPEPQQDELQAPEPATAGTPAVTFDVPGGNGQHVVNVSKGLKQPHVAFPPLTAKPGFVRGYVKDGHGKPLVGATIGVRSTAMGGFYSGASGKTDAKGYYEIAVPGGAASFYNAGYSADYYDGRAAFGLVPADGETSSFASTEGAVENWILPLYGAGDPDDVADQPQYFGNYYGGSFTLGYSIADPNYDADTGLPVGSEVDLSLVPVGNLFDGSRGKSYEFKQKVEEVLLSGFYAVNIPVGQYRVMARLRQNGRTIPLNIKETGPYANNPFGLEPKTAQGSAVLTFRPDGAKSTMVTAGKSNWESLAITLSR